MADKINVYGYFQSDELDADGNLNVQVEADRDRLVNALVDVYYGLPQFIQDQVQSLGVADSEVDVDITELSAGRKLK